MTVIINETILVSTSANKQLLYVDDARYMHRVLKLSLPKGYDLSCADSGEQALRLLAEKHFDLIISDINMPQMNGLELLEQLRQLPNHASTPVLLISAEDNPDVRKQGKSLGANGFLIKPFKPYSLKQSIDYLLQQSS